MYQHNKITKKVYNNLLQVIIIMKEIMTVTRDPKTFYFNFDSPKSIHQNLKHEIKFIKSKKILLDR